MGSTAPEAGYGLAGAIFPRSEAPTASSSALVSTASPLNHLGERAGWFAVCIVLLTLGVSGPTPIDVVTVAVALYGGYRCWSSPYSPSRRFQALLLGAIILSITAFTIGQVGVASYTDSVAFGQYSAKLVLNGLNPFTHSLAPSLTEYRLPLTYVTHYLNGSTIVTASYPAGSFLFYVPALLLGWHTQAAVGIDVAFWIGSLLLMWILLPKSINWLAALFLASSVYIFIAIGSTDCLYMPFILVALWRWDRFRDATERTIARWIGPIALGVAMSVKQTPWFLLPFLLIGVAFEAHQQGKSWSRQSTRYLVICMAVFVAINIPWILANPRAWLDGSIAPLVSSFVPVGHGLIELTLIGRIGGGDLRFYTLAGVAWLGMALLLMGLRYRKLKRVWVFLVIVSFFLVPRSLASYLIMLVPAATIAALTVRGATDDGPLLHIAIVRRFSGVALLSSVLLVFAGVGAAAFAPAPLNIKVLGVRTNGEQELITDATVQIHNNTDRSLDPTFAVNGHGSITNFWTIVGTGRRSTRIFPHQNMVLTLQAPDFASMGNEKLGFQMVSYTTAPPAVSSSQAYTASGLSIDLTSQPIGGPIPIAKRLVLSAQLRDSLGRSIHRAGLRVDLGQLIYTEGGILRGVASINGLPEGASPVAATTNLSGVTTFTVTGLQADTDPDYFQAWIASPHRGSPPTGYSQMVEIRFSP